MSNVKLKYNALWNYVFNMANDEFDVITTINFLTRERDTGIILSSRVYDFI